MGLIVSKLNLASQIWFCLAPRDKTGARRKKALEPHWFVLWIRKLGVAGRASDAALVLGGGD